MVDPDSVLLHGAEAHVFWPPNTRRGRWRGTWKHRRTATPLGVSGFSASNTQKTETSAQIGCASAVMLSRRRTLSPFGSGSITSGAPATRLAGGSRLHPIASSRRRGRSLECCCCGHRHEHWHRGQRAAATRRPPTLPSLCGFWCQPPNHDNVPARQGRRRGDEKVGIGCMRATGARVRRQRQTFDTVRRKQAHADMRRNIRFMRQHGRGCTLHIGERGAMCCRRVHVRRYM